ncbi:MAG: hypothetical protein R3C15_05440 [Thermoleophilia bacterium]
MRLAAVALACAAALPAGAGAAPFDGSWHEQVVWSTDGARVAYQAYEPQGFGGIRPARGVGVLVLGTDRRTVVAAEEAPLATIGARPALDRVLDPTLRREARIEGGELVVRTLGGGEARLPVPAGSGIAAGRPWSPDGTRLLLAGGGVRLRWIDVATGTLATLRDLADPGEPRGVWSADGTLVAVPPTSSPTPGAWAVVRDDGVVVGGLPPETVAPSPDLRLAIASSPTRGSWLVDTATGVEIDVGGPTAIASWSADGSRVLLSGLDSWLVVDRAGTVVRVPQPGGPVAGSLSPDGALLAYVTPYELVVVDARPPFAVRAPVTLGMDRTSPGGLESPAWSPDGKTVAVSAVSMFPCLPGVHVVEAGGGAPVMLTNDCRVAGTPGDDVLVVRAPARVRALAGDDRIVIAAGGWPRAGTHVDAGPGDDVVVAAAGSASLDTVLGGAGNDVLRGGAQDDTLLGGTGDDRLDGGTGRDLLAGGPGDDRLVGGPAAVVRWQRDLDRLDGGAGDDVLRGGARGDVLLGRAGRDVLVGGAGRDELDGGPGPDRLAARDGERDCLLRVGPGDRLLVDAGLDAVTTLTASVAELERCITGR